MSKQPILEIKNLHAGVENKQILKGFSLTINAGEVHALMGLNGSGKSTLAAILAGRDGYDVTEGTVKYLRQGFAGTRSRRARPRRRCFSRSSIRWKFPA